MAVTVTEKFESPTAGKNAPSGGARSRVLAYNCIRDSTEEFDDVMTALLAAAPTTTGPANVLSRTEASLKRINDDTWEGTVNYERPATTGGGGGVKYPPTGTKTVRVDTTGGTTRIKAGKELVNSYAAAGETAPTAIGALINVTDQGTEGVNIPVPRKAWTETKIWADASITQSYINTLDALVGKTNDGTFRSYAEQEVLFLGYTLEGPNDDGQWSVTYHFEAERSVSGLTIGTITNITKAGMHYLWVLMKETSDGTPAVRVQKPQAVFVDRIYDTGSFSGLSIGTGDLV